MAEYALMAILIGSTVASTAMSVYSHVRTGQAEKKAERRAETIATVEAAEAKRQARVRADIEEERHRRILATQRAKYGFYGMDVGGKAGMVGSPLEVRLESMRESARDIAEIMRGGDVSSSMLLSEAKWHGYMAGERQTAGWLRAGTSLLTGAGEVASMGMDKGWW